MDVIVDEGRSFSSPTVKRFCRVGASDDRVILDLSGATFVDPIGLVTVAALVENALSIGAGVDLRLPRRHEVRNYLSRMRLGSALDAMGVENDLRPVVENPLGDRIFELTRFDSDLGGDSLGEAVYNLFEADDAAAAREMYLSIVDATQNVCQHSGRDGGWAALQHYRNLQSVGFAVADCGVGLQASLSAGGHHIRDPQHAIELAIERGVSGTGIKGRGMGLDGIVNRARSRGGKVQLWSGRASAHTGKTVGSLYPVKPMLTDYSYPGTVVYATLDLKLGGDQT